MSNDHLNPLDRAAQTEALLSIIDGTISPLDPALGGSKRGKAGGNISQASIAAGIRDHSQPDQRRNHSNSTP